MRGGKYPIRKIEGRRVTNPPAVEETLVLHKDEEHGKII
jgi:hypothetical protein